MNRFDPYKEWFGISICHQPPDHYRLLGLRPGESDVELIRRAIVGQTYRVEFHRSADHVEEANRLLKEIAAAGETLLDHPRKTDYDRRLMPGSATPIVETQSNKQPKLKRAKALPDKALPDKPVPQERQASPASETQGSPDQPVAASDPVPLVRQRPVKRKSATHRAKLLLALGSVAVAAVAGAVWFSQASDSATLVINWPGEQRGGRELFFDGHAVAMSTESGSVPCRAGRHEIRAIQPGREPWVATVVVHRGEHLKLTIALPQVARIPKEMTAAAAQATPDANPATSNDSTPDPGPDDNAIATPADVQQDATHTELAQTGAVDSNVPAQAGAAPKAVQAAPARARRGAVAFGRFNSALKIGGSWSGYRPNTAVASAFSKDHHTPVRVFGMNGDEPFADLKSGTVDVLMFSPRSQSVDEEVRLAFGAGESPPKRHLFGQFAVQIIVHPSNPVTKFDYSQLAKVLSGDATRWNQVGDVARPIELVGEMKSSKAYEILTRDAMQGQGISQEMTTFPNASGVAALVGDRPGAIGFCMLMDKPLTHVKVLRIAAKKDGPFVRPTKESVMSGEYPLREELLLFTRSDGPEVAEEYCTFAKGPAGAKAALASYLIPAQQQQEFEGQERLADRKEGNADSITAVCSRSAQSQVLELATQYTKLEKPLQIKCVACTTEDAIRKFTAGEAEILVSDDPLMADALEANESWAKLRADSAVLGWRAIAVVIHPGTTKGELSLADLTDIWNGKLTKWPATKESIHVYSTRRDNNMVSFLGRTLGSDRPKANLVWRGTTDQVVKSVEENAGSIGFVDLSEFGAHPGVPLAAVRRNAESAAAPTVGKIPRDYPLAWPVVVYASPASDPAKQLVAFIQTKKVEQVIKSLHLYPPPR